MAAGSAADAIVQFDKSFPKYQTLNDYFNGLVNAFYVSNQVEILDEEDAAGETKLSVRWDITLTDRQNEYTDNRSAEISFRLVQNTGKWKIADLEPISLFDPAGNSEKIPPAHRGASF